MAAMAVEEVEEIEGPGEKKIQVYTCKLCSFKTNCPGVLKVHECSSSDVNGNEKDETEKSKGKTKTRKPPKDKQCPYCDYKGDTGSMSRHVRRHTGEKPYSCKECDYKCTTVWSLTRHSRVHSGEKPFSCDQCDYKCALADTFRHHLKKHNGDMPFVCDICGYKCTRACNLDRHMRKHTGERPYGCPHCGYKCSQAGNLKEHIKTHTEEKPFFCTDCGYRCTRAANMDRHMRTHIGKLLTCIKCEFQAILAIDFFKHFKTHFQKHYVLCTSCDFKCYDHEDFEDHLREVNGVKSSDVCSGCKILHCSRCDFFSPDMLELNNHTETHPKVDFPDMKEEIRAFVASTKNEGIKNGQGLKILPDARTTEGKRKLESPEVKSNKPIVCIVCGLICESKDELTQHSIVHLKPPEPELPSQTFSCTECDYKCMSADIFNEHLHKHNNAEMPFSCDICGYGSSRAGDLQRHMRKHTGERPYICPHCGYKCSQGGNLKVHMKTHTEEKPFFCTECAYRCTRAANLDRHMKIHPGKNLTCLKCDYWTVVAVDFLKHFRTHFQKHYYACNSCEYQCYDLLEFEGHRVMSDFQDTSQICTGSREIHCSFCDYIVYEMSQLSEHIEEHPEEDFPDINEEINAYINSPNTPPPVRATSKKEFVQALPDRRTTKGKMRWKLNTLDHKIKKENAKGKKEPIVCLTCGLVCLSAKELKEHSTSHDPSPDQVPPKRSKLICNICHFSTVSRDKLNNHECPSNGAQMAIPTSNGIPTLVS